MSLNVQGFNQIIIKSFIMKKSILNLGKTLNKTEQKEISGGSLAGCLRNLPPNDWEAELACYKKYGMY